MNDDEMSHNEMDGGEMQNVLAIPLPVNISDECAAALCDFLAELSMAADSHYLCQVRRYRKKNRPPLVDPESPWITA
jgi:hypothetical protein